MNTPNPQCLCDWRDLVCQLHQTPQESSPGFEEVASNQLRHLGIDLEHGGVKEIFIAHELAIQAAKREELELMISEATERGLVHTDSIKQRLKELEEETTS